MDKYDEVMSTQYGGNHYKDRKIQPWEVWEAYDMNGWEASALKYLLRYKNKGKPLEDLLKCLHNIQYLIAREERKQRVQDQNSQRKSPQVFEQTLQDLQRSKDSTENLSQTVIQDQRRATYYDEHQSAIGI